MSLCLFVIFVIFVIFGNFFVIFCHFLSLFVSLPLCLFASLPLCLFAFLPLCLFVSLSLCLFVSLSLEGELKCYAKLLQTYRHTDPSTKRVLEEHSLLKRGKDAECSETGKYANIFCEFFARVSVNKLYFFKCPNKHDTSDLI